MNKRLRLLILGIITFLAALLLSILFAPPSYAHLDDLSGAEGTLTFLPSLNQKISPDLLHRTGWLGIAAAFFWGGTHALSPGHGKTLLGAYLVGTKATSRHALFLGLTTTLTHTIGVFAMGLIALFASRYILPEQLYPWLSLTSGAVVAAIGLNLARQRWRKKKHHHHHHHSHSDLDNTSVTWKNLIALGISGGLVPCPAALVLLLSAIAWGQIAFGLALVIFFSLGLATTLTGLGLFLVNAKQQVEKLPGMPHFLERLPILSAVAIAIVGLGICLRAAIQIEGF